MPISVNDALVAFHKLGIEFLNDTPNSSLLTYVSGGLRVCLIPSATNRVSRLVFDLPRETDTPEIRSILACAWSLRPLSENDVVPNLFADLVLDSVKQGRKRDELLDDANVSIIFYENLAVIGIG